MEPPRLVQIDLLKGLAIIAVIATHTLTFSQMVTGYTNLYLWQAIPIFIIIMAFNAGNSFTRRGDATLRGLFSPSYFARRFERIVYPVLLIGLFELVIMTFFPAVVNNAPLPITPRLKMWLPPQTPLFLGWLPLNAPGNYFVSIAFQFIVLFPLLYYFYKRASRATLVGCLAVNVAFEFAAPYIIANYGLFWYTTSIVRYLGAIGLGLWITDGASVLLKRNWFIVPGAAFSFVYLVASDVARTNVISYFEHYWFTENVASFFYPLLLVVLGLMFLPRAVSGIGAVVARCGQLSYHIFLVQLVFFEVVPLRAILASLSYGHSNVLMGLLLGANVVACCALGRGFAWLESGSKTLLRKAARLLAAKAARQ
jgi:peptidoglycan/LPS O-acetylase OafA/YrhL